MLVRLALGTLILGSAGAFFAALVATRPTPPQVALSETSRSVRLLTLAPVEVTRQWLGFGTSRPLTAADISAQLAATVAYRPAAIEPGVSLRKGDLIVALVDNEFRARAERARQSLAAIEAERASLAIDERAWESSLSLARENVALLKNELERLQQAVAAAGASAVELDRLRRDITRAERDAEGIAQLFDSVPARRAAIDSRVGVEKANLELATIDLERTRVRAPFDGVLQEVAVRAGERVAPGALIARLVNLERMETPIRVPVSALVDIAIGSRADLLASGTAGQTWTGAVSRIAPEADAQTRTATVFVEIVQNPAAATSTILQPGRFVTARVYSQRPTPALVVPRSAINGDRALRVDASGRAQVAIVQVSFHVDQRFPSVDTDERQWAVLVGPEAGLSVGDQVIISNLDELLPGMMIRSPSPSTSTLEQTAQAPISAATRAGRGGVGGKGGKGTDGTEAAAGGGRP